MKEKTTEWKITSRIRDFYRHDSRDKTRQNCRKKLQQFLRLSHVEVPPIIKKNRLMGDKINEYESSTIAVILKDKYEI